MRKKQVAAATPETITLTWSDGSPWGPAASAERCHPRRPRAAPPMNAPCAFFRTAHGSASAGMISKARHWSGLSSTIPTCRRVSG